MTPRLVALTLLLFGACANSGQTTRDQAASKTPQSRRSMDASGELYFPYAYPTSTDVEAAEVLPIEETSSKAYEQALAAYAAHEYVPAARSFMAAAQAILRPRSAFNGAIMAENRLIYY